MKNKVIAVGHNRFNGEHAEMMALRILNHDIRYQNKKLRKKLVMYVIAVNSSNKLSMSKPCILCHDKIVKNNIRTIYYSTTNTECNIVR